MIFGSVCSGIEAASVAWHPLGWKAAWLAEIEPFPSAVLNHHYPDVPNLGDMTKLAGMVANDDIEAPDVLVGGTPCQAFSVAGARKGLSDDRGFLTIKFVELADEIDKKRAANGFEPAVIVWENVPGVLSSKDNAFGAFLGLLAGEDCELQPSGGKWSTAGCVLRGKRAVAWRVLDAQYFGVAQRRRRVFVVASARAGFDPTAILFESEGLRRDIAPSRESRTVVAALTANGVGTCGADDNQGQAVHLIPAAAFRMVAFGEYSDDGTASTMKARDYKDATDLAVQVIHGTQDPCVGNNLAFALGRNNGGENVVCYGFQPRIGRNGRGDMGEVVSALTAQAGESGKGDSAPCVAVCVTGDITHTLKAEGFDGSEDGTGRGQPIVAQQAMQVRRLTPTECERLQGFPDGYTLVPAKGKPAADGPRYKALGNSMAVPCMNWIGKRIASYSANPK